jgi:hypothetical protein
VNAGSAPSSPTRLAVATGRVPLGLRVASTLCWLWCALVGAVGAAAILPPVLQHGRRDLPIELVALLLLVAGYLHAGWALRRSRRSGAWTGSAAAVVWSLALLSYPTGETLVSLVVNAAILVLIAANRRHLR